MRSGPVDPRDVQQEFDAPVYRVYFWGTPGEVAVTAQEAAGVCEEHRVLDAADVVEVLAWADRHADGRWPVVYAEHDDPTGRSLLRLRGVDPNELVSRQGGAAVTVEIADDVPGPADG